MNNNLMNISDSFLSIHLYLQIYYHMFYLNKDLNNLSIEKISNTGTLLLPTFNWDFCRGLGFDYFNQDHKADHLEIFP